MKTAVAVVAMAGCLSVASPAGASDRIRPVDEGGDTRPCVTYAETEKVYVGSPRGRVERVLDTPGKRVNPRSLDGVAETYGADQADLEYREVRSYRMCAEPELGTDGSGVMLVQYNVHTRRDRAVMVYFAD